MNQPKPGASNWIEPKAAQYLQTAGRQEELACRATDLLQAALSALSFDGDADVFEDKASQLWVRRIGPHYFPDPNLFASPTAPFERWAAQAAKYRKDANDYWFHVYKPASGDTIVDIGAGRGEDVFVFSQAVGGHGLVWAIEPHPESFAILQAFCRLNNLSNVETLRYACVDQPASLQIETLPVWESNFVRAGSGGPASFPVEGVTFDSLCELHGIDKIDFMKMNIEGAERFALKGCREALGRTANVCIAAHDFRSDRGEGETFRTLRFVRDFLTEAGFELTTRDADPRYYVPYHVHGIRPRKAHLLR